MGIKRNASLADAVLRRRRVRRHSIQLLNEVESELSSVAGKMQDNIEDTCLWRRALGFKTKFSTKETWNIVRVASPQNSWLCGIWFSKATPRYAFVTWLAVLGRLSTMDRIARWNQGVDPMCVLCKNDPVTRDHLFFECSYSSQIWDHQVRGISENFFY